MSPERKKGERNASVNEEHPCVEMSEGVARYLMAISDLSRSGERPTQARLARELDVSQPSALEMVRKLRGMAVLFQEEMSARE